MDERLTLTFTVSFLEWHKFTVINSEAFLPKTESFAENNGCQVICDLFAIYFKYLSLTHLLISSLTLSTSLFLIICLYPYS